MLIELRSGPHPPITTAGDSGSDDHAWGRPLLGGPVEGAEALLYLGEVKSSTGFSTTSSCLMLAPRPSLSRSDGTRYLGVCVCGAPEVRWGDLARGEGCRGVQPLRREHAALVLAVGGGRERGVGPRAMSLAPA